MNELNVVEWTGAGWYCTWRIADGWKTARFIAADVEFYGSASDYIRREFGTVYGTPRYYDSEAALLAA